MFKFRSRLILREDHTSQVTQDLNLTEFKYMRQQLVCNYEIRNEKVPVKTRLLQLLKGMNMNY